MGFERWVHYNSTLIVDAKGPLPIAVTYGQIIMINGYFTELNFCSDLTWFKLVKKTEIKFLKRMPYFEVLFIRSLSCRG